MKTALIIGGVILIAFGAAFFARGRDSDVRPRNDAAKAESAQERAPEFSLKDWQGNTVSLSDFRGRVVVANSWAVWCPFCREELPDFAALQKEFNERIVVIAIDRQEPAEKQKRYTDELGVTGDFIFLLDPDDSFYRSIGAFSMPETIFVDGEGFIRFHKRGPMALDEMREKVKQILNP